MICNHGGPDAEIKGIRFAAFFLCNRNNSIYETFRHKMKIKKKAQ